MNQFENYIKEKKIIDIYKASKLALALFVVFLLLIGLPFYLIWKPVISFSWQDTFLFSLLFLFGVILHELIHGLCFGIFAKNGFRRIRFGILWEYLTPYCHCNEPLRLSHYVIGALMPGIVLGFAPSVLSLIVGNIMLLILGVVFISAAAGDFYVVWILRKESMKSFVLDHPSEPGCFIYRKKQQL